MSKPIRPQQAMVFCGIDVSAETLAVAVQQEDERFEERVFENTAGGHEALIAWLQKRKVGARVSLEATGIYSLDLALALDRAEGIEVAVLNPKVIHRFAQTLRRSKTDSADAQVLAEYSRRMPFAAWVAPELNGLRLRTISRHIQGLVVEHTRQNNRLHAAEKSVSTPHCVVQDLKRSMASLKLRIAGLRGEALGLVRSDEAMRKRFELLIRTRESPPSAQCNCWANWLRCRRRCLYGSGWRTAVWIPRTRCREPRCISRPASAVRATGICATHSTCRLWLQSGAIRI